VRDFKKSKKIVRSNAKMAIPNEQIKALNRSAGALKSSFTRAAEHLDQAATLYADNPSKLRRAQIEDELKKLDRKAEKVTEVYILVCNLDDDENRVRGYNETACRYDVTYRKTVETVMEAIDDVERRERRDAEAAAAAAAAVMPQRARVGAPPAAAAGGVNHRVDMALRPKPLTAEFTVRELRYWEEQYVNWYQVTNMVNLDIVQQRAYFMTTIDRELSSGYMDSFPPATPVITPDPGGDSLIGLVRKDFMLKVPLFNRRHALLRYKQSGGNWDEHRRNLRKMGEDADVDGLNGVALMDFLSISSLEDKDFKEHLMRYLPANMVTITAAAHAYETAKLTAGVGDVDLNAVSNFQKRKKAKPQQERGKPDPGACNHCARPGSTKEHIEACFAKNLDCRKCKKKGHIERACRIGKKPTATNAVAAEEEPPAAAAGPEYLTWAIEVNAVASTATPRLMINLKPKGKRAFKANALPDSGATRSIINHEAAVRYGAVVVPDKDISLIAANGSKIACTGTTKLQVVSRDKIVHTIDFIATSDVKQVIVGWQDLMAMGVLGPNFPALETDDSEEEKGDAVDAVTSIEDEKDDTLLGELKGSLLTRFRSVFADQVGTTPMKGDPMHIH
jgi:hypothetical protein